MFLRKVLVTVMVGSLALTLGVMLFTSLLVYALLLFCFRCFDGDDQRALIRMVRGEGEGGET